MGMVGQDLSDAVDIDVVKAVKTAAKVNAVSRDFDAGKSSAQALLADCAKLFLEEEKEAAKSIKAHQLLGEIEARLLSWRRIRSNMERLEVGMRPLWYRPVRRPMPE